MAKKECDHEYSKNHPTMWECLKCDKVIYPAFVKKITKDEFSELFPPLKEEKK